MSGVRWEMVAEGSGEVGGRATDLSQVGYSLRGAVREHFPINGVPEDVVELLDVTQNALNEAEKLVERLGALMVEKYVGPEEF